MCAIIISLCICSVVCHMSSISSSHNWASSYHLAFGPTVLKASTMTSVLNAISLFFLCHVSLSLSRVSGQLGALPFNYYGVRPIMPLRTQYSNIHSPPFISQLLPSFQNHYSLFSILTTYSVVFLRYNYSLRSLFSYIQSPLSGYYSRLRPLSGLISTLRILFVVTRASTLWSDLSLGLWSTVRILFIFDHSPVLDHCPVLFSFRSTTSDPFLYWARSSDPLSGSYSGSTPGDAVPSIFIRFDLT